MKTFPFVIAILLLSCFIASVQSVEVNDDYDFYRVTPTDARAGVRMTYQRLVCYMNGRHWIFFSHAKQRWYTSSPDGQNWADPVPMRGSNMGADLCITVEDNGDIHYVYSYGTPSGNYIWYRKGQLRSDGVITWYTNDEQLVIEYEDGYDPQIELDSKGYPWITIANWEFGTNNGETIVFKSSTKDGTWTMANGFPYILTDFVLYGAIPLPLKDGKMYFAYGPLGTWADPPSEVLYGKLWDGSWKAEERVSTGTVSRETFGMITAVSKGDEVCVAFVEGGSKDLVFRRRSPSGNWGSEITLLQGGTTFDPAYSPTLTYGYDDDLFCFWLGYPEEYTAYYCVYDGSWSSPVAWFYDNQMIEDTAGLSYALQSSPFRIRDGIIGMAYRSGPLNNYEISYTYLTTPIGVYEEDSGISSSLIIFIVPIVAVGIVGLVIWKTKIWRRLL